MGGRHFCLHHQEMCIRDSSTDAGATWSELYLWPEGTGEDITFMLPVTEAEEAELLIRAYNTYELRTEAVKK